MERRIFKYIFLVIIKFIISIAIYNYVVPSEDRTPISIEVTK